MRLPRDLLSGEYIAPDVFLCQTDKEIISKIQVLNLQGTFKWAQYSEISCTIPRIYIDETSMEETLHPAYDLVEGLRLIYLDGFGYFQIQEPTLSTDGIREVKEITAFSSEYMLSQKYLDTFVINKGVVDNAASIDGVQLYNQDDTEHSLLHLVLSEKAPEWTIGHVDPELATEQRSFEVDKQSIYDFLTNDVQNAFKCVVLFNTITNEINIYKEEEDEHYQTDVYMTFDNLSKNVNISYTADDIKTMITVTGDEDLDIREVNFGLPYILDLSYYHTIEWMGQKLYDKFSAYQNKLENSREAFRNLSYNINEANEELEDLQGRSSDTLTDGKMTLFLEFLTNFYHYIKDTKDAYMPDTTLLDELTEQFIGLYDIYTKTKDTELKAGKTYYTFDSVHQTYNAVQNPDVAYISTYYEKDPRSTAWRNAWNSFTATISNASVSKSNKDAAVLNILRTNIKSSNPVPTIFNLLGLEFLTPYQDYYKKAQSAMVTGGISEINGWPTNENSAYHQYYALKKMLDAVEDEIKLRQSEIDAIQKTLNGLYTTRTILSNDVSIHNPVNFDADDLRRLSPFLREDEYSNDDYVTTDNDTYKDKIDTEEELLNDALTELHKLAQPQLRIDENIFNLLALPEFAPIQYQFELGNFVTTEIRPDYIKKSRLLEVTINFDNLSEISVVFGDLIDVKSQADVHADLLSQAISVGKQVASSAGHWTSGTNVATEMQNKLNQGLLDAATVLKSIDGTQNVEIDKYGIHLSTIDSGGDKSPKQGWIVNNQLAYTDDNWLSTKSVFGEFTYDNKTYWGVLADAVVAGYIEGSVIKGSEIYGGHIEGTEIIGGQINGSEIIGGTGSFSGSITASSGTIGGWTIGSRSLQSKIYFETAVDNSNWYRSGMQALEDGATLSWIAFYAGCKNESGTIAANSNFYVTHGGKLYCNNAEIEGKVTANNGTIGGWSLTSSTIYRTNSSFKNANGMYFGSSGLSIKDKFWVTSAGALTAYSATLYGNDNNTKITITDRFKLSFTHEGITDYIEIYQNRLTFGGTGLSGVDMYMDDRGGEYLKITGTIYPNGIVSSGHVLPFPAATYNLGSVTNGWQKIYIGHGSGENNGLYISNTSGDTSFWVCGINQYSRFVIGTTSSDYIQYYQSRYRSTLSTGQSFRIVNGAPQNSEGTAYDYNDPSHVYIVGGADSTSTYVGIPPAYNRTTTTAANLYINSNGLLSRSTSSSRRYKHDIRSAEQFHDDMMSVLDIGVVKFKYNDGYVKDGVYNGEDVTGFIAEQIEDVCPECATYEDGKVESWNERIVIPKMLYVLQQQQKEIQQLHEKISALERI